MTASFDDLIAGATLPTTTVTLCVAGELQAQWEDLERELQDAIDAEDDSLASGGESREIAERMDALREAMRAYERTVKFQALSQRAYSDLLAKHPPRKDNEDDQARSLNIETFPPALIAACAVEPVMTEEQVKQLAELLTNWQFNELFGASFMLNRSPVSIPKSVTVSEILANSAPRSKPPEPGVSPVGDSSVGSLAG